MRTILEWTKVIGALTILIPGLFLAMAIMPFTVLYWLLTDKDE